MHGCIIIHIDYASFKQNNNNTLILNRIVMLQEKQNISLLITKTETMFCIELRSAMSIIYKHAYA
jgi:hypothetical protein